MRIACIVLLLHLFISLMMLLFVACNWLDKRDWIADNGWTLKDCTPLAEIEIPLYFIPIVNLFVTYFALKFMVEFAVRVNIGQVIDVYLGKFGMHYQQID